MLSKITLILIMTMSPLMLCATEYNDWTSIDARPVPRWWTDAKFGIFIHWGVYAVPSYSNKDNYAEWYWEHSQTKPQVKAFHNRTYGPDFEYSDFVPMFKAELFDPDAWADLFKRAGAKYVVLTAKHVEGYCLWKNQHANKAWGRKWNSVETGPQRDIVAELTESVRNSGLKMGCYFVFYEWNNPVYRACPQTFIEEYSIPQFKELVTKYQPSIIFGDGDWQHSVEEFHGMELAAWLLNNSEKPEELVFNDRWGKGTRGLHGGYFSTEYSYDPNGELPAKPWEECRGIGSSFGYNRNENIDDYSSGQELILTLIDIVSRGGNLLLDVGPEADGRIPVIMQERLIQIGKWLEINGQAIYGSQPYKTPCQWNRTGSLTTSAVAEQIPISGQLHGQERFNILNQTVAAKPGQMAKEIFFTQKQDSLYAITPKFPLEYLTIKDLKLNRNSKITLLGTSNELKWTQQGKDIKIIVPPKLLFDMPPQYAYTFKITKIDN